MTNISGDFWIDYYDSIETLNSKNYCWRREQYIKDNLFSIEYLALNKHHPIKKYTGYFPNGNIAFKRSYFYDGENSEAFGDKELYYENGNLKEKGLYRHGIKYGNWIYYNDDGSIKIWTQYESSIADTISSFRYLKSFPSKLIQDTITIDTDTTFIDLFPCASFGKNGIEVLYEFGKPIEARKYEYGQLILTTKKRIEMKKLIKRRIIYPDIILCMHRH
jgi:antitoxin component YwqK of YwqJK toxin-antitoxin module